MRIATLGRVLALLATLGVADAVPALAADEPEPPARVIRPGSSLPGKTLTVTPPPGVDLTKGAYLQLTGPSPVDDSPITLGEGGRRIFHVTLPKEMRQGRYTGQIVDPEDKVLVPNLTLRVRATEPPTITRIVPHPSYPSEAGYSFELQGERFGEEARDNVVKINDEPITFAATLTETRDKPLTIASCQDKLPCLIGRRRHLQVFGFSLDKQPLLRPTKVSVEVDRLTSAEKPLILSWVQRRTPVVLAFVVVAVLAGLVFLVARQKAKQYKPYDRPYGTLAYLLIEQETNTYSLSRFQLLVWTAAAVLAYVYLGASQSLVQWRWQLPEVPEGLPSLLGLSVATTALAIGATGARGSKGAGSAHPGVGDFLTNGGVFASERLQFFVWTILGVCGFVSATLIQDPATLTELPKIPDSFLPLMGVSSLGYLAGKVLRKPGPIIRQVQRVPTGLHIVGENLSPRAQVFVGGRLVEAGKVKTVEAVAEGEYAADLRVDLSSPEASPPATSTPAPSAEASTATPAEPAAPPPAGAATRPATERATTPKVRVVNPDGQSAEV